MSGFAENQAGFDFGLMNSEAEPEPALESPGRGGITLTLHFSFQPQAVK